MAQQKPAPNKVVEPATTKFFVVSGSTSTQVNPDQVPEGTKLLMVLPSGMMIDTVAGFVVTGSIGVDEAKMSRAARWDPVTGSFPNLREPRGG